MEALPAVEVERAAAKVFQAAVAVEVVDSAALGEAAGTASPARRRIQLAPQVAHTSLRKGRMRLEGRARRHGYEDAQERETAPFASLKPSSCVIRLRVAISL